MCAVKLMIVTLGKISVLYTVIGTGDALGSMCEEVKVIWEFRSGDAKLFLRRSSVECACALTAIS